MQCTREQNGLPFVRGYEEVDYEGSITPIAVAHCSTKENSFQKHFPDTSAFSCPYNQLHISAKAGAPREGSGP